MADRFSRYGRPSLKNKHFKHLKMNEDGTFEVSPFYEEIHKLREMMVEAGIPHRFQRLYDGWQIGYPRLPVEGAYVCSVVEHFGSYGSIDDLLEIKGLLTDKEREVQDVLGDLLAEEVFERIKAQWEKSKEE